MYKFTIFHYGNVIQTYKTDIFEEAKNLFDKFYYNMSYYCKFEKNGIWIRSERAKKYFNRMECKKCNLMN